MVDFDEIIFFEDADGARQLESGNVKIRWHLAILTAVVVLLRLPFINQAVGGDDVYYLAAAYHALIDPLHPNHTTYVFEGREVTFQGYPHPPGNAAFLAVLLAICKDVIEPVFHFACIGFSLVAVYGMYALARRFSKAPLWATLLFVAVPAFLVNGNTLESDVPLLACWMAGAAAFIYGTDRGSKRLLGVSGLFLGVTGMIAMQSFLFTPILLAYAWLPGKRRHALQLLTAFVPVFVLIGWQMFERATSGQFPAMISAGYIAADGFGRVAVKFRNALALSIHACFMVFPILIPFMIREVWRRRREPDTRFLAGWVALFLCGAWVIFYAGSARYLLPIAAPLAILASYAPLRWVQAAVAAQMALSLGLATVNYQHWNGYRTFAASLQNTVNEKRVWVDGEWGLRHYLEAQGALPLRRDQWIPDGDVVVQSELAFPAPIPHGGRELVPVAEAEIRPWLPLRLIGLESRSGYSTDSEGLLPFDFRGGTIDRVRAYVLRRHEPAASVLSMNSPETDLQIVSGIYPAEGEKWRWMSGQAQVLLKSLGRPAQLELRFYIAETAPSRTVTLGVSGGPEVSQSFPGPGSYVIKEPVDTTSLSVVSVKIQVDRTFVPPGDQRTLGIILNEIGLR